MHGNTNIDIREKHELEIGTFIFTEHYVLAEMNEGSTVSVANATKAISLAKKFYGTTKPFVYISNRKNSYAFDPMAHFKTFTMFPNALGFVVVTYNNMNHDLAKMEQAFINKPTGIVQNLDDAIAWAENCYKNS